MTEESLAGVDPRGRIDPPARTFKVGGPIVDSRDASPMDTEERARDRLRPVVERARRFSGWRLDEFAPRRLGSEEPWSYEARASELLANASSVLDMGTGGGEVFEDLWASRRGRAVATESWKVNAPVAAARLRPHGIDVVLCHSLVLPFRGGAFDLVLNRHEELDPAEVARVVRPGGRVLTQQIGREWWRELREFFPRMEDFGDLFDRYRSGLRASGLTILQSRSHEGQVVYRGLGDIVFLLCVAPWTIPDFDPLARDLPALLAAEESLSAGDEIVLTEGRFLIEAAKGARSEIRPGAGHPQGP